jgi:long-chain acyl-CoA synthetase
MKSGPFKWQSYETVAERRINFGAGLIHLAKTHLKKDLSEKWYLGLYAINRPEWMIADLACHAHSLGSVALYDTLGAETVEYVINHSELSIIVTSLDKVATVLQVAPKCPNLRVIISMDSLSSSQGEVAPSIPQSAAVLQEWAKEKGIHLLDFSAVEKVGKENPTPFRPPSPQDTASVCYTSGILIDLMGKLNVGV